MARSLLVLVKFLIAKNSYIRINDVMETDLKAVAGFIFIYPRLKPILR
jgi:hypothetical protein